MVQYRLYVGPLRSQRCHLLFRVPWWDEDLAIAVLAQGIGNTTLPRSCPASRKSIDRPRRLVTVVHKQRLGSTCCRFLERKHGWTYMVYSLHAKKMEAKLLRSLKASNPTNFEWTCLMWLPVNCNRQKLWHMTNHHSLRIEAIPFTKTYSTLKSINKRAAVNWSIEYENAGQ